MSRLSYDFSSRTIKNLLEDDSIDIPDHQRPEMWSRDRQQRLIKTIMDGLPIPNLILNDTITNGKRVRWLEDGQQRYISMKKFMDNKLDYENVHYKDLDENHRFKFLTYKIAILTYENATRAEIIQIFDNVNNGVPLSPGHRFHARLDSPLVKFARERILTPEKHFYARASAIWGAHPFNKDTKTKRSLMNAMALAGGAAHGVECITTSYDVLGPLLHNPFDAEKADGFLDKLISVYEAADAVYAITPADKKKQWEAGRISGYILASLIHDYTPDLVQMWSTYLVNVRKGDDSLAVLHAKKPASRNWNSNRWRIGYENVFVTRPTELEEDDVSSEDE
jgi:uncharacterized UPF0146 family protein